MALMATWSAARVGAIALESDPVVDVLGLYVPSRDRTEAKVSRKTDFIRSVADLVSANDMAMTVLAGDYNVIERRHIPKHSGFFPFEYEFLNLLEARGLVNAGRWCNSDAQFHSWIGRFGDGYCYDYFHAPTELLKLGAACVYIHETRELRLTDHAAVELRLDGVCAEVLPVEELTEADQVSLF